MGVPKILNSRSRGLIQWVKEYFQVKYFFDLTQKKSDSNSMHLWLFNEVSHHNTTTWGDLCPLLELAGFKVPNVESWLVIIVSLHYPTSPAMRFIFISNNYLLAYFSHPDLSFFNSSD